MRPWLRLAGIAVMSLAVALGVAWFAAVELLHESQTAVKTLLGSLLMSGGLALVIGFLVIVVGMPLLPRLAFKLVTGYLVVSLAAILTVLYTPVSMFVQPSDLYLLILLLAYFLVIAVGLAGIMSLTVTRPLHMLAIAAREVGAGAGALRAHVEVASRDEVFEVASAFNKMSSDLTRAAVREQTMEEERRRMIAAISHDLRTPLTGVRLTLEGIQDGLVRDGAMITQALSDIDHLGRLIEDLFELSQLEEGTLQIEREAVNARELVSQSVNRLRPVAEQRNVALLVALPEELPDMVADSRQLQRAISNLVQNGIQHTPPGGEVRVRAHQSQSNVIIEVADTGVGIAPGDLPYIFEYFYRADASREQTRGGAGLGLSIARAIVAAHGGTIRAESEAGQGTRFTVTLPVS